MAQLPSVFRAQDHESMDDFSPIPADSYMVEIVKSEIKDTKAGDGKRLVMQAKVMSGDYKGRLLFIGLNIINPNPTAVEMAHKELKSITDAVGKGNSEITDSQMLHAIPFMVDVVIKPATDSWPEQNQIKKYYEVEGGAPAGDVADGNPFADEDDD